MIKKIKRLLEVGEETQIGDRMSYMGQYDQFHPIGKVNSSHPPICRETLVLELPPIPEGFRLLTKEDKTNKLKGEFKHLNFSDFSWANSNATNASYYEDNICLCIIKPKQKGFTIKDVAPGMTFILDHTSYNVKTVCLDNFIGLERFGQIPIEILNKHFSCLNSDGVITPCSEYQS